MARGRGLCIPGVENTVTIILAQEINGILGSSEDVANVCGGSRGPFKPWFPSLFAIDCDAPLQRRNNARWWERH